MSGQITITVKVSPAQSEPTQAHFEELGFSFEEAPHAFWRGRADGCIVTFYQSGKVVLQGPNADAFAGQIDGDEEAQRTVSTPKKTDEERGALFEEAMAMHPEPLPERWVGIDETGKGDYFGPLVVVAAAIERHRVPLLIELGIADSKKLSDKFVRKITPDLKACCVYSRVIIRPERYNELYAKIGNLNHLLAWGHARALEDALEMAPDCTYALSDQFARNPAVVERQLMELGRGVRYEQRTKGESDPAVAVASVLARDIFLTEMKRLEKAAGRALPKGAGGPVLAAARDIANGPEPELLRRVAKLHFKTTQDIGLPLE
jgi:ribonuclease HIII